MNKIPNEIIKKLYGMGYNDVALEYMTIEDAYNIINGKLSMKDYIFKTINKIIDVELEREEKLNELRNTSSN